MVAAFKDEMMLTRFLFPTISLFSLVTLACGSSSSDDAEKGDVTTTGGKTDPATYCATLCSRTAECNHANDKDTCVNKCTSDNAAFLPKLRPDLMDSIQACITKADCATALQSTFVQSCLAEAVVSIAPVDSTRKLCEDYEAAKAKCDSKIDRAKCLTEYKAFNDATVAQISQCMGKTCAQFGPCVKAATGY
jgi:hypothetical protein